MANTLKKMKITIIVLAVLLGISLAALAGVIIHKQSDLPNGSAVVPNNYIEPKDSGELSTSANIIGFRTNTMLLCASVPTTKASVPFLFPMVTTTGNTQKTISIYKNKAEDSEPFNAPNMFPGDSETKTYLVKVSHKGTVTVRFHADIRDGYEKLAEVLKCKVVMHDNNQTLYNGLMRDMPESLNYRISSEYNKTTKLTYDITVYLDTSVGNEYMNKELVADFRWWVEDKGATPIIPVFPPKEDTEDDEPTEPGDPTEPEDPTIPDDPATPEDPTIPDDPATPDAPNDPDDGELVEPPPTKDSSHFCFWFGIAVMSLLINIILLSPKQNKNNAKRKDKTKHEQ